MPSGTTPPHNSEPPSFRETGTSVNGLLEAIYQSAMTGDRFWRLQSEFLVHFARGAVKEDGPYVRLVLNHVRRALRIGYARAALDRERQVLADVIDRLSPPVLVIDRSGYILGQNGGVEPLLERLGALGIRQGTLFSRESELLEGILDEAEKQRCAVCHIDNDQGHSIQVYVYRNRSAGQVYSVLFFDRHASVARGIRYLAPALSLTRAETAVMEAVVYHPELQDIAEKLDITMSTLRQHLKNLYAKCGVHSRSALVALVLQNVVLSQAADSGNEKLLPHIAGYARSGILRLACGRNLGYAEFGDPGGIPVVYFHALNGSRLEQLIQTETLVRKGIRFISVERPGIGHSTPAPHGSYMDFVPDVVELLDHLGLRQVCLLGYSAGCAHALAMASAAPHRVRQVFCTAMVPPGDLARKSKSKGGLNGALNTLFRLVPGLVRPALELAFVGQTVESVLTTIATSKNSDRFHLSREDIDYVTSPECLPYTVASMVESLRQGTRAWAEEAVLMNRPWPFEVANLQVPVTIWHGRDDLLVPADMVEPLAERIAHCDLNLVDGETHLYLFRHMATVAEAIHAQDGV